MSELLVLLWTARCLESHTVFLRLAQSPLCQPQLLRLLLPRMPDLVHDKLEQRKASAWGWPNSTGFHVITAKFFPAATRTTFPAEVACASLPCSCPNPRLSLLEVWAGRVIWRCARPAVPLPFPSPRGDYSSSWQQYCPWRNYNGGGGKTPLLLDTEVICALGLPIQKWGQHPAAHWPVTTLQSWMVAKYCSRRNAECWFLVTAYHITGHTFFCKSLKSKLT